MAIDSTGRGTSPWGTPRALRPNPGEYTSLVNRKDRRFAIKLEAPRAESSLWDGAPKRADDSRTKGRTRRCHRCDKLLPLVDFPRKANGMYGFTCAPCRQERAKHGPRYAGKPYEKKFDRHLRRAYGITLHEYKALAEAQGGGCAICHQPSRKIHSQLSVDHDHATGKIRGLICHACNQSIGMMLDDPALLRAAADYIEQTREPQPDERGTMVVVNDPVPAADSPQLDKWVTRSLKTPLLCCIDSSVRTSGGAVEILRLR
jgi:hypothetical protein